MNDDNPQELNDNNESINQNKLDDTNPDLMICQQHKRKIEFICYFELCQQRYLCSMCQSQHEKHLSLVDSIDSYLDKMMDEEQKQYQQRKQMIQERATQMRKIVKRISKSFEQYEIDELADLQQQFENVSFISQQDKYIFARDYQNDETAQFKKEANYQKIYDSAKNMLNFIQKKDYNLQKLIGIVVKQDNLFDMVDIYHKSFEQSTNRNQNNQKNINIQQNNVQSNQQNNQQNIQQYISQQSNQLNHQNEFDNIDNLNNIENNQNMFQNNENNFFLNNLIRNNNQVNNIMQNNSQINNQRDANQYISMFNDGQENNYEILLGNRGDGDLVLQFEIDESELLSEPSLSNEIETDRKITALFKLTNNIIVFNELKTIYYYDFIQRKILYKFVLNGNANIHKMVKLNENRIVVLLNRKFSQNFIFPGLVMVTLHYEVYMLEIKNKQIKKYRIFAQQNGLEIKDIIPVKNSPLIAIVQESKSIILINSTNGKQVAQYNSDAAGADQFEGISSCTFLNDIKFEGILYKNLIAINQIDGQYGLWDFASNKFIMKKQILRLGQEYKMSTCVTIQQPKVHLNEKQLIKERRARIIEERDQNQQRRNQIQKSHKLDIKDNQISDKNRSKQEHDEDQQQQKCLIFIKGERNETFLQNDFNGLLEVKMNHRLMDYFDLFYNNSAIPFYFNNSIFFYDFNQNQRLQTIQLNTKYQSILNHKLDNPSIILDSFNQYLEQNSYNHINSQISRKCQAFQSNNRSSSSFQNAIFETPKIQRNPYANREDNISQFNYLSSNQRISNQLNINRNIQFNNQRPTINNFTDICNITTNNEIIDHQKENQLFDSNYQSKSKKQKYNQGDEQSESSMVSEKSSRKSHRSELNQQKQSQQQQLQSQQIQSQKQQQQSQQQSQQQQQQQSQEYEQYYQQMHLSQQKSRMTFSQIWDEQLVQFQQNQRNIQGMDFQENERRDRQQCNINNQNSNINSQFNNRQQFDISNRLSSILFSSDKLFDICPIAIINHFEFVVVVFPNGLIQYIK